MPRSDDISLQCGQFGFDYIVQHKDGRDLLVQTDWDYPGIARTFGWRPSKRQEAKMERKCKGDGACLEREEIGPAGRWLSYHCGMADVTAEDPGYFEGLRRRGRGKRR